MKYEKLFWLFCKQDTEFLNWALEKLRDEAVEVLDKKERTFIQRQIQVIKDVLLWRV